MLFALSNWLHCTGAGATLVNSLLQQKLDIISKVVIGPKKTRHSLNLESKSKSKVKALTVLFFVGSVLAEIASMVNEFDKSKIFMARMDTCSDEWLVAVDHMDKVVVNMEEAMVNMEEVVVNIEEAVVDIPELMVSNLDEWGGQIALSDSVPAKALPPDEMDNNNRLNPPLTFEDDDFLVTIQELDLDNLQGREFELSHNNYAEDFLDLEPLMSVEIVLEPEKEIEILAGGDDEQAAVGQNNEAEVFESPISEEVVVEGKNDGVHILHSCKRTYIFDTRCLI